MVSDTSNIQRLQAGTDTEAMIKALEDDGCLIIEGLLPSDDVLKLQSELEPYFEAVPNCQGDFFGYETKRLSGLVLKSDTSQKMALDPTILALMDEFLLRGCLDYQLNLTQAIQIGPGEPQQILHRDDAMFPFEHDGTEAMINCMWAVDDFTIENGATHAIPGSHKWPKADELPEDAPPSIQAEMKKGSVLIYFGSLVHGGGANQSPLPRTGVVISYSLGWLRQAENHYLSVPLHEVSKLPRRLQTLLGYFVHAPNLGCVEGQSPASLLADNLSGPKPFEEFLPDTVKPMLREYRQKVVEGSN